MIHWLAIFAAAFLAEAGYVLWVRSREPSRMALLSVGIAPCQLVGLSGGISGLWLGSAYVAGFSAGSYCVGWITKRLHLRKSEDDLYHE